MTAKQLYFAVLVELRKTKAPHLRLEDFLYWANKGVQEYINTRYATFAQTMQVTDDLAALSKQIVLELTPTNSGLGGFTYTGAYKNMYGAPIPVVITQGSMYNSNYIRFVTPPKYWHLLGMHITTETVVPYKCWPKGTLNTSTSKRLTADIANGIIGNSYLKPDFNRLYYSIFDSINTGAYTDLAVYYGNPKKIKVKTIAVDYLKTPEILVLNKVDLDAPVDNTQVLEFPEYVCNEIVKRITTLLQENSKDPRVQTYVPVNQSIK